MEIVLVNLKAHSSSLYKDSRNGLKLQFGGTFRLFNYLDCNFSNQGSTCPVVIHDSQQGFEVSPLNPLLSRTFSLQDKKIKIIGIINGICDI